jgi:serralysin
VSNPSSNIFSTIHDVSGNSSSNFNIGNTSTGYHTYGVLWTPQTLTFYVDGQKMFSTPTPADYNQPMYMLMDLAVGGSWPGSPNSSTNWSQANMNVDYVRAYSLSNTAMAAPATISTSGGTVTGSGGGTTTTGSSGGTTATLAEPNAVLSNATGPTNLSSSFSVPTLSPGTSATYTAGQLGISGVASTVTVTVADDLNNGLTVTNNGAWGGIKDVTINSPTNGNVNINNFVDAQISLGNGGSTVTASGLMRGSISVGDGNSTISINATSNSTKNNTTTINAGNGSDQISFTGASNTKAAITAGNLGNTITVGGQASATVKSGTGNDDFVDKSTGSLTLTGGGGSDVFEFLAGAHATITDFQAGQDGIVLPGLTASQIKVTDSHGNTYIALGNNSQVELAGVSLTTSQLHITYA